MRSPRSAIVSCVAVPAALSGLFLAGPRPGGGEVIDRVLAAVGGQVVTLSDARAALALGLVARPAAGDAIAAAVEALIDRRLILTEVDRYQPVEPDPAAVARRTEALLAALPAEVPVERALASLALDRERLAQWARDDLRIQAYIAQRFGLVQPSDEEVAAYYRERVASRGGAVPALADVADALRAELAAARRDRLVAEWLADLRRRADITVLYRGGTAPGAAGRRP